ncbi:MAG: OmpA family protein [Nodosilinea sp.]
MSDPSSHPSSPGSRPAIANPDQRQPTGMVSAPPSAPGFLSSLRPLWSLLVGVTWLGGSLGLGWVAGLLLAQVWPSPTPTMPAQERVMRQASRSLTKLRQLPQWWQGDIVLQRTPEPTGESPTPPPPPLAPPPLSEELQDLTQELGNWKTRLVALEKQLDQPAVGTLEQRLTKLQERVRQNRPRPPAASPPTQSPASGQVTPPTLKPYREPEFSLIRDRIVLPGPVLFEPGSSTLTRAGEQLLTTIQPDLGRYGAVTLMVASHTTGPDSPEESRQLSFAQAQAVRTYLAQQLPQTQFHWLVVGFGATRPLVVNQADSQNRNQRIEIGIVQ